MGKVEFGWRIPAFPVDESRRAVFTSQIVGFIGETEDIFDSMWIDDHFIPYASFVSLDTDNLESWTTLCYLAGRFQKPKFGNIVLCNSYRNPALLAKMAATIDVLSNGRFILGIGAGWKEDEYRAYGYEFPEASVRIKQLEEALQIIKSLWTKDDVTFNGKYFKLKNAFCDPKPDQPIPIMIGGGGEKLLLRIVAKYADWWNVATERPEEFKHKLDVLEAHCRVIGRDPKSIKKTLVGLVAIAKNESDLKRLIASRPNFRYDAQLIGIPDKIREKLLDYIELGVELFILRFLDFPSTEGAKLFSEQVISRIK